MTFDELLSGIRERSADLGPWCAVAHAPYNTLVVVEARALIESGPKDTSASSAPAAEPGRQAQGIFVTLNTGGDEA